MEKWRISLCGSGFQDCPCLGIRGGPQTNPIGPPEGGIQASGFFKASQVIQRTADVL